ncbi:MAG: CHAT domain-containing protein [Chloroflexales bacterium]|jgi:CHAT domain
MTLPPTAEETLRIQILPSKHPERFQVSLNMPGIPLLGGPALRPNTLMTGDDIRPLRLAYEQQIAMIHEMEVVGVPVHPADPAQLRQLGRRVVNLLPTMARQGIVVALRRSQRHRCRLRIEIETTAETRIFLAVPWELMVLPITGEGDLGVGGEDFLLQDATVSLVRQVRGAGLQTMPYLTQPLAVQAFLAAPLDGCPIESATTHAALEQVLSPAVAATSWYSGSGTLSAIQERLRASSPQILHLLCHGEESPTGYGTRHDLIFTHRDGFVQRVSAFDLVPLLSLAPQLQIVVLQACHSGSLPRTGATDDTANQVEGERRTIESIALTLVRQGIPAVIAMQGEIGQEAAGTFVQVLYEEFARGSSLDRAVAASRTAMRAAQGWVDWSIPVVYQGSGQTEVATWYTQVADRIDAAIREPVATRTFRGALLAWALVLLAGGVSRWLIGPISAGADLAALARPLGAWIGVGLVGPAIIATAQRGARGRDDLSLPVLRAARYAQWGGAYLGYALSGLLGLFGWVSLWALGLLALLPVPLPLVLFIGVLLGALGGSYVIARSQWRSCLSIAPVDDSIYTRSGVAIIIVAALIMIAVPLVVFILPNSPFGWLLRAEPAALALVGVIISFVLGASG